MAYAELKTTDTIRFIDTRRKKYKEKKPEKKHAMALWFYELLVIT